MTYITLNANELKSITGGRRIIGYRYQSGLGRIPIYDTDAPTARGLVDGYFGIFGGFH